MRFISVHAPERGAVTLQDRFSLTDRETQIVEYLVAGCTREFIQKELVLSASTVKTHIGHIYEKTGVHSKQELMDLVRNLSGGNRRD